MAHDPEWISELFAGLGPVRLKRMFSGYGVYFGEFCVALAIAPGFCLRVDDATRATFETLGARPFTYEKQGGLVTVQAWWQIPEALLDEPDELTHWARLSLEAARRRPPKKPRKPRIARTASSRIARPRHVNAS